MIRLAWLAAQATWTSAPARVKPIGNAGSDTRVARTHASCNTDCRCVTTFPAAVVATNGTLVPLDLCASFEAASDPYAATAPRAYVLTIHVNTIVQANVERACVVPAMAELVGKQLIPRMRTSGIEP